MPIIFHETSRTFHLYNDTMSYIFQILKNEQLGQLYAGKRIHDRDEFSALWEIRYRDMSPCLYPGDYMFSLENIKQEYPSFGTGDMRNPAFDIEQENGSHVSVFTYQSHVITKGKKNISGLPTSYVEGQEDAQTLCITLFDEVLQTQIDLYYTIFEHLPIITRHVEFIHQGKTPITIRKAMSINLDLPDAAYEMMTLPGAWGRERHIQSAPLHVGIQQMQSMRGHSSGNMNPFIALRRKETVESVGEVWGFTFLYSGNFLASVEVDTYETSRIMMGIHPQQFSWTLQKEECFCTPEAVMVLGTQGLNSMSQAFHTFFQDHVTRGRYHKQPRPILINNWEATYFNFNEEKILQLAQKAKEAGIELLVLDDGWFGKRNDDRTSLGDWFADTKKLPDGIASLAKKVQALGLQFGLWFEPEMVSEDSCLYREHPDYVLGDPSRTLTLGRNQYVLDFSRPEVVDHIAEQMYQILDEAPISYIKWDMNRSMTEVFSRTSKEQGRVYHAFILGLYSLYERLLKRYPHILFESCASGGARFDGGMLYYAPQAWTSDDTDAVERLKIQYGTSLLYPISAMGSHVSAVPNHQVNRMTSLAMRGDVAYFGTFGYELNLHEVSDEDFQVMKEQIDFMKQYRSLFQYGTFYRLQSPFENNVCAWMVVSKDQKEALVGYYRVLMPVSAPFERIYLQGLQSDLQYLVTRNDTTTQLCAYGDQLMHAGLITSDNASGFTYEKQPYISHDFQSRIYHLTAVNNS